MEYNWPSYCKKCGSLLKEVSVESGKYNELTGKKIFYHWLVCPNRGEGILSFFSGHTNIEKALHNADEFRYLEFEE